MVSSGQCTDLCPHRDVTSAKNAASASCRSPRRYWATLSWTAASCGVHVTWHSDGHECACSRRRSATFHSHSAILVDSSVDDDDLLPAATCQSHARTWTSHTLKQFHCLTPSMTLSLMSCVPKQKDILTLPHFHNTRDSGYLNTTTTRISLMNPSHPSAALKNATVKQLQFCIKAAAMYVVHCIQGNSYYRQTTIIASHIHPSH